MLAPTCLWQNSRKSQASRHIRHRVPTGPKMAPRLEVQRRSPLWLVPIGWSLSGQTCGGKAFPKSPRPIKRRTKSRNTPPGAVVKVTGVFANGARLWRSL